MKLITKFQSEDFELGEVVNAELASVYNEDHKIKVVTKAKAGGIYTIFYNSLAELNDDFEDYEEPKEYWYIEEDGDVIDTIYLEDDKFDQKRRLIGNYFSSREEAEKAVEKLKAWKRLRDKGFRFERWFGRWLVGGEYNDETRADLDLLFGGEE